MGGPASFRGRIISGLTREGYFVATNPLEPGVTAILVIGGTRRIDQLWQARRKGIRIVQRLNGMNWVHRRTYTGLRHFLRCEVNNWILATIRGNLAHHIVYQSTFTADWWSSVYKNNTSPFSVIHNGVDLEQYSPSSKTPLPADLIRILVVEGRFGGGYEVGLENAVRFSQSLMGIGDKKVKLILAGDPGKSQPAKYSHLDWIDWKGIVTREDLPALYRSAHLLFSSDIRPSCPNSVIEAMACGLPVLGYDTGALLELVGEEAGAILPYGGDFLKLQPAHPEQLAQSALRVLSARKRFSANARRRAEKFFDLNTMVRRYLEALLPA